MIFTALSFYGFFMVYLLYEEVMSVRLYDTNYYIALETNRGRQYMNI